MEILNNSNNSVREEEDCDSPMKQESESMGDYSTGLPSIDDLTPLSQSLIPSQLASAFKITLENPRTMSDVTLASNSTFSSLNLDPKRIRGDSEQEDEEHGKKRPRLVWTPQLHKRFVEVVAHLGLKNAVPKTIMQLMNVEGLTRENVASHLQKYRLYVKRMQENNTNDHHSSDNFFASTPIPQGNGFNESYNNNNNNNNNNNSNSNSNSNSHVEMQMGMGGNSLHHHHHYHHHYQQPQQYGGGGGGQQQNHYGFSHHLPNK